MTKTERFSRGGFILGGIVLLLSLVGLATDAPRFFQSYLFAYLFWLGLPLGAFAIFLIYYLTGGRWGAFLQPLLEASTKSLWIMALLFIPLCFGLSHNYEWARPERFSEMIAHKRVWFNRPFVLVRAVFYFFIWIGFALKFSVSNAHVRKKLSGIGLLIYGLTVSFAGIDWLMSIEADWYSTIFGMIFMLEQGLGAMAFLIFMRTRLNHCTDDEPRYRELGNLLLTFLMVWAYLSFSQFLIIWSGNLPEEVHWYRHRLTGGWSWIASGLIVLQFAAPFACLLFRGLKRRARFLSALAIFVLAVHVIEMFWLVMPSFHLEGFSLSWLDFTAVIGIGGVWLGAFGRCLDREIKKVAHAAA